LEKVGNSFERTVAMSGAAANVKGTAYQYVILQGEPAALAVYKIPSRELVDEVKLPNSTTAGQSRQIRKVSHGWGHSKCKIV